MQNDFVPLVIPRQTTNRIAMVEPYGFTANPQTMVDNVYQSDFPGDGDMVRQKAILEFKGLRDKLIAAGVDVVTFQGQPGCPDDVFCNNWISTHQSGQMVVYPIMAENRRPERRSDVIKAFEGEGYTLTHDFSAEERYGRYLESTGSLVLDRVNKVAYAALSNRTDLMLTQRWGESMGYEVETFLTRADGNLPVYHTNVMMYIGTAMAGICPDVIVPQDRARVRERLSQTHEILDFTAEQIHSFCGNAIELAGFDDQHLLVMSSAAHDALSPDQIALIQSHTDQIIHSPLPTIERYGGGSARCMILERI